MGQHTKTYPIDLSMLTAEEITQFDSEPDTLYKGTADVCLYLRYSSEKQTEQSIEGQLRDCRAYCARNDYRIKAIYVDRAQTAAKNIERRTSFQKMVTDSDKKHWEFVVVWKLDRFARSRNDSALYKYRLKRNGVRVLSATEDISQNPEGIILEAVLEGIAEYYSADLSQKITRGMRETALKCQSVGGVIPLGYKIENHKLVIDELTADLVRESFARYAAGDTVAELCRDFNARGYRTSKGAEFNRNSFKSMFRNRRYIGVYKYKDIEIEDGVPALIEPELFEAVQLRLKKNGESPARGKAKVDYLLSGKVFCGHCGNPMLGDNGHGKTGIIYNYYNCASRRRKLGCDKKPIRKDVLERAVCEDTIAILTDDLIEELANMAMAQSEEDLRTNTRIPELTSALDDTSARIDNLTKVIERGIVSDSVMTRLDSLEKQKKRLEAELKDESADIVQLDKWQIIYWLEQFRNGDIEDEAYCRRLVDLLVSSVTVWDDPDGYKITIVYNLTEKKSTSRVIPYKLSDKGSFGSPLDSYPNILIFGAIFTLTTKHPLP